MFASVHALLDKVGKNAEKKRAVLEYGISMIESGNTKARIKVSDDLLQKFYALQYGVAGLASQEKKSAVGPVKSSVVISPVLSRWAGKPRRAALRMYIIRATQRKLNETIKRDLESRGMADEQARNEEVNYGTRVSKGEFSRWRAMTRTRISDQRAFAKGLYDSVVGMVSDRGASLRRALFNPIRDRALELRGARRTPKVYRAEGFTKGKGSDSLAAKTVVYRGIAPQRILTRAFTAASRSYRSKPISGKALLRLLGSKKRFLKYLKNEANSKMRAVLRALKAITPSDKMRSSNKWGARKRQIRRILEKERPHGKYRRAPPERNLREHGYTLVLCK